MLSGKKAIVTGANRSIGQAIAISLANEGADVLISYCTDKTGAEKTVAALKKLGKNAEAICADFSNENDIRHFFDRSMDFLGAIDILVNNASGYNSNGFLELDLNDYKHLLHVGTTAPLLLTQLAAKQMIERKVGGSIVNISSITGIRPYEKRVAFSTSKAALNMMTQNIALDLAPYQIRVNAIAPGSIPYESDESPTHYNIPLGRFGKPQDIANMVIFLASDKSSWITGQILTVDGGQSLSY